MPNRVTAAIAKFESIMADRLAEGLVTEKEIAEFDKSLDMDFMEYANFQTRKSLASVDGTLTLEEAQTIYGYLGETLDVFNGQPFAVKYILTEVFQSLLNPRRMQRS
jgi:hypothetical protein